MKWQKDAEMALKKVPFFVRKKVRIRVEEEVMRNGRSDVSIKDLETCKKRFLNNMESDVKGYQLEACFGKGGCPHAALDSLNLQNMIERIMQEEDLLSFLKREVDGPLRFHHEFRITLSDCPNACSQPQIKDIGIIGAAMPILSENSCSLCGACSDVCKEDAVLLVEKNNGPIIEKTKCVRCGKCVKACMTCTIEEEIRGYRVLIGGKLGRHPKLAKELRGIKNEEQVVTIIRNCVSFYKKNSKRGERFAELINREEHKDFLIFLEKI